jgi:WD40 repeat protein
MLRILVSGVVAGVLLTGIAWTTGIFPAAALREPAAHAKSGPNDDGPRSQAKAKAPMGQPLYVAQAPAQAPQPAPAPAEVRTFRTEPIIIANSRLALLRKQDVPAMRDGPLMFIGIELRPGENVPPFDQFDVQVGDRRKTYRRLREGDTVAANELVARVDNTLAVADREIKEAKVKAAIADQIASEKTRDEAKKRWETQQRLYNLHGSATSLEELRGAELTYWRYVYEAKSKVEAIRVAEQELAQAKKIVDQHDIRTKIGGIVKNVYKQPGEMQMSSNKGMADPVIQVQNYDQLRVEGLVEVQYRRLLQPGMEVVIEPTVREDPEQTFVGHRLDITGVAVTKDAKNPQVVSCSEDGTIIVWDRNSPFPVRIYNNDRVPVRAVACTPPTASGNLVLSGDADGRGRIWDLSADSDKPAVKLKVPHRSAILCAAFSPDGKICATGGEDRSIMIWDTETGELRYRIDEHHGAVTALHFLPQSDLVSASRDDTVRFWKLGTGNYEEQKDQMIRRRGHEVGQLGVSADGQKIMDEGGSEMRILSLPNHRTEAILRNISSANKFRTLALFAPNDRLALTTGDPTGVLQLWRLNQLHSYELRQFIPGTRSEATCAAFSPDGRFVVAGGRDRKVFLWTMPTEEEVNRQLTAHITNVERTIENSESQVRIMAEMDNPKIHSLMPGDIVNMVVYPQRVAAR